MPDRPSFERAVQELLRTGALKNCPMCSRNEARLWKYDGPDELTDKPLRLACSNCHYIVEFDSSSEIDAAIKRREGA